jgi:CubicO group peptidase (beta-lactamase class C family)
MIIRFAMVVAASVAQPQQPQDVGKSVSDSVQAMADRGDFSGTVLIAHKGTPILEISKGMSDRKAGRLNTMDTRFNLASGDKMFTKIAIGQLILEGKIALGDTVGKFLPDYPNQTVRQKVTVQHLLRHTSGLGSFWNERFPAARRNLKELRDFQRLFETEEPAFEPGKQMRYSNNGYIVLGRIVEAVSGQSYYEYVRSKIFQPAGMKSTAYLTIDEWPSDKARGYTTQDSVFTERGGPPQPVSIQPAGKARDNTWSLSYRGSSAGSGYSTARELVKLDSALRNGVLGDTAALSRMFMRTPDGRQIVANGGGPGGNMEFTRIGDYTIIVLSNFDPPAASRIAQVAAGAISNDRHR